MINSYKKVVFEKYATFEGRATRSEYWWFTLANWIVGMVISFVGSLFDPTYGGLALQGIYSLAVLIPSLAVGVRRLHETNHSGWWLFISLIPIVGWIWILVLMVTGSDAGENDYGPEEE